MSEHSPTPWRVSCGYIVFDADGVSIASTFRCPDAALIVEAVNHYHGAVLNLAKQISLREKLYAELGAMNDVAVNLTRSRDAALADADRLRDLVRRLVHQFEGRATYDDEAAIIREAREAVGEDEP